MLSAYAGFQIVCEEKRLKVVNKPFSQCCLDKMRNFAEAENFLRDASVSAVLLTGRCSKCELFSLPCLKNGEAGDKK